MAQTDINRRRFLKVSGGLVAAASVSPAWARQLITPQPERSLEMYNLHTGERVRSTYWVQGQYIEDELASINHLLRDHRSNGSIAIDRSLLDLLHDLKSAMNFRQPVHIISGYRSPETNAMLSQRSGGVARKSLHMQGKAIDIRLPGVQLEQLHDQALALKAGGVGYYRRSQFVHLDVGRVRNWRG